MSIIFDDYDRYNWSNLKGIRIQGIANILNGGDEYKHAHPILKEKYPEYRTAEGGWAYGEIPIIKIAPRSLESGQTANGKNRRFIS